MSQILRVAIGVSLVLLGLYVLTSPGRIDMIDGQVRYEVARNWIDRGRPVVLDRALISTGLTVKTPGAAYGVYNAAASVVAMPIMLVSRALPRHTAERDRFLFAMVGPLFGAVLGGMLVVVYSMLGLSLGGAVAWALVCTLGTLWWPASTTVFDQNQHAVWLLLAVLLAWESGRRGSVGLALLAGGAGAALVTYQENYALLLPLVGMAVAAKASEGNANTPGRLRQPVDRATVRRYVAFGAASSVGLLALIAFNYARFGAPFNEGRFDDPMIFGRGNVLAALLGLLVSPGKGFFLFSPPLLLAFLGARRLLALAPALATTIVAVSLTHLLVVAQVAFFGGDWCWGPRYLLVLAPLWALAGPFAATRARRIVVAVLVVLGVSIQVMAISLDHHRFFYERNLAPHFWAEDPWFYFRSSQLLARPGELAATWLSGVPTEAVAFSPTPWREVTYSPFGPRRPAQSSEWVRRFAVFYLPRPWPLWFHALDPAQRPVAAWPWLALCGASIILGGGLVLRTLGHGRAGAAMAHRAQPSETAALSAVPRNGS
jgi:hypothetical protein